MYNRSFYERTKIQFEIYWETCVDTMSHQFENVRRPLFIFIGIAALLTIRSARRGVSLTKTFGYSPWKSKTNPYGTYGSSTHQYGGTAGGYGTQRAVSSQYGATTAGSQYGAAGRSYGTTATSGSQYGVGGTTGQYGQAGASQYGGSAGGLRGGAASSYGSNIAQTQTAASAGVNTASLVDMHGASVQVVQGGLFRDFGAVTNFMGQVDTVSAMDSPGFVQQVLQTPGLGKILVVDGGGSLSSAILDSNAVTLAQQNGWKGIIVNGAIRNADSVQNTQVGIKALGTHPVKGQQNQGQHGMALSFGGVNFSAGNWVYADKDGIVVSQVSLGVGSSTPVNTGYAAQTQLQQTGTGYGASTGTGYGASTGTGYGASTGTGYGTSTGYGATTGTATGTGYGASATNTYGQQNTYGTTGGTYGGTSTGSTLNRQYGGQTYGGTAGSQSYKGYTPPGTTGYNHQQKSSKRKTISLVLLACAVVWVCLGD